MKRIIALLLVLAMALLAGCSTSQTQAPAGDTAADTAADTADTADTTDTADTAEPVELVVFAAASLQDTMEEIAQLYQDVAPEVEILYNFDSSGTLKTQIQEGADCDIFISAAPLQMNQLDAEGGEENTEGLDFVDSATRLDLLENKVVLAVPEGNPAGIESFDQLAQLLTDGSVLLAMGNEDVPVGQYTQRIFAYYGLDEATLAQSGVLTYGSNVREVTTQVSENSVDCGIIYATDAHSAGLTPVDEATAEMCGQVIYPAAVLKISRNAEAAQAFLDYLSSDDAAAVFQSVGFTCFS